MRLERIQTASITTGYCSEILLNYAEAMAEAYGPDQVVSPFTMSAREAVNLVRSRKNVKMPKFPTGMSKADFLARLHNERRVELAFEGHRFWDLRRWKALGDMKDIYKVNIEKRADGTLTFAKEKGHLGSVFLVCRK